MIHSGAKSVARSVTIFLLLLAACIFCAAAAYSQPAEYTVEIVCCGTPNDMGDDLISETCCSATGWPDWRGRRSDTFRFFAYQVGAVAVLYVMPESVSRWSEEDKENFSLSQWWENVQHPTWDSDAFYINYILHPYWGGAYFVRSRERGFGEVDSFWYSAALSASYEFGAEAFAEQPSIQDLIVTPVGGWFVGRYFMALREDILAGHDPMTELPFRQRFILAMTDPLGAINNTVNGWFGLEQRFNVQPYVKVRAVTDRVAGEGLVPAQTERMYGVNFTYVW
jgi:Domain of unknown function (DUF3943)